MIIYNSMIVWIGIMFVLHQSSVSPYALESDSENQRVSIGWAIITFAYIIFWIGERSGVADTAEYISGFTAASNSLNGLLTVNEDFSKAPGFLAFEIILKSLFTDDYHVFLMIIAVATGIPIAFTLRKYSESFFYSAFLFIVTLNFTWMYNGIRQFLVVAIMFACMRLLVERRIVPYIILVLLLSTFHSSALLLIPIYWIATAKPWSKRICISIAAFILVAAFAQQFTNVIELFYSGYAEQASTDDGINPLRVVVALVPCLISFYARHIIEEDGNEYVNMWVNMSVLSAGFYLVGVFTSGILVGRIPIYFEIYNLLLYPYLFNHCFTRESRRIVYIGCAVCYIGWYYLQMRGAYYISDITGLL